jgi:hypothetical protein
MVKSLIAYFDETGHPDDPAREYVGMAGFVAPAAAWQIFEEGWNDLLRNAGLREPFSMKHLAHFKGQFKPWEGNEKLRRLFIGSAVKLIVETGATPLGAVVSVSSFETLTTQQQSGFLSPYYIAFQNCTRGAAVSAAFETNEKVAMVYAFNSEYGTNDGGRAGQLWSAIKQYTDYGKWMDSYSTSMPDVLPSLQAADLLAYELSHEFENRVRRPDSPMRWPLRQIMGMYRIPSPRMTLFDRKELLRITKESNWPDQTGVEELGRYNWKSAQESMTEWMIQRGGFTKDHYAGFFEAIADIQKGKGSS